MKLRETRYKTKSRKNPLLKGLDILLCIGTVMMWASREGLGLKESDLLIMTGLVLLLVSIANINRKTEKKNRLDDKHIDKLRDEIGTENYKNPSVFFK